MSPEQERKIQAQLYIDIVLWEKSDIEKSVAAATLWYNAGKEALIALKHIRQDPEYQLQN